MNITVKLIGGAKAPAGLVLDRDGGTSVVMPEGASVTDVMERLRLPDSLVTMVDSRPVPRTDRAARSLVDGDEVTIFPPLKGG